MSQNPTETTPGTGGVLEASRTESEGTAEATENQEPPTEPPTEAPSNSSSKAAQPESQGRRKVRRFGQGDKQGEKQGERQPRQPRQSRQPQEPQESQGTEHPTQYGTQSQDSVPTDIIDPAAGPGVLRHPLAEEAAEQRREAPVREGAREEGSTATDYLSKYPDPFVPTERGNKTDQQTEEIEPGLQEAEPYEDSDVDSGGDSRLSRPTRLVVLVLAVLILVIGLLGVRSLWSGDDSGDEAAQQDAAADSENSGAAGGQDDLVTRNPGGAQLTPDTLPVVDTGIVFESLPRSSGGEVTLRMRDTAADRDYAWKGKIERGGQDGETGSDGEDGKASNFDALLLEGRTYADFRGGFGLPKGDLRGGTFAWAVPGGLVVRAEYDQAKEPGSDGLQEADGTYKVLEEQTGQILLSGTYSDVREPNSIEVVRTYIDREPGADNWEVYRRAYKAPPETPIPMLVGWEEPKLEDTKTDDKEGGK